MVGYINFPVDEKESGIDFYRRWVDLGSVKLEENFTIECYFRTEINARMPLIGWFVIGDKGVIDDQLCISVGPKDLMDPRPFSFITISYNNYKYTLPDRTEKKLSIVADGKWHQLSLRIISEKKKFTQRTQGFDLYIDGKHISGAAETKFLENGPSTGQLLLGSSMFIVKDLDYQSWIGDISEVRLWNGNRKFLPYIHEPVATDADYLRGYWPFWGAYRNGTQNVSQKSSTGTFPIPILKDTSFRIENDGYYNLYTDTLLNGVHKDFPQFGTQADTVAITYILDELKSPAHGRVIQKNVNNLKDFRKIYQNSINAIENIFSSLSNLNPSNDWKDDTLIESFNIIKGQLLIELNSVTLIYKCSSQMFDFMSSYATNAENALEALSSLSPIPEEVEVEVDTEQFLEAAQLALQVVSIIVIDEEQGQSMEQPLTSAGEVIDKFGTALEIASSVVDFSNPKPSTDGEDILRSNYMDMKQRFIDYYNKQTNYIESRAKEMVTDWGKLDFISQDVREFKFPRSMSEKAAVVLRKSIAREFTLSCLSSYYTKFVFTNMSAPNPSYTGMNHFQKIDMNLAIVEKYWDNLLNKEKYKITTILRADGQDITESPSYKLIDDINEKFGESTISTQMIMSYEGFKTETKNCGNGLLTFSGENIGADQIKDYIASWHTDDAGVVATAL